MARGRRHYSTRAASLSSISLADYGKLNPYYFTGFTDGEGCFSISITKKLSGVGWKVTPSFAIRLSIVDTALLHKIKVLMGVGEVYVYKGLGCSIYAVKSLKDLTNVIIPHFIRYPLISQKHADFELFKMVIDLINKDEHLTLEGLRKILCIKASMNTGLSTQLKIAFPDIIPVERPKIDITGVQDPN